MIIRIKGFLQKKLPTHFFEVIRYVYNLKYLIRLINIDLNDDYRNATIVSGTGRSGTTWIANILNFDNEYRYMFEPFNPREIKTFKRIGGLPYMRTDNKDPEVFKLVKSVLSGRIKNNWINKYNRKIISRKRLIKDIDINPLLKWIKVHFPEVSIILIMRHPFAVAYSKVRLGWWDADQIIDKYLSQKELVEDFLKGKAEAVRELQDDFSKFIFIWCIENIIPLTQFSEKEVHLIFYEDFCRDPKTEARKMFGFLGRDMDERIDRAISRPSGVIREDSAIFKGRDLISDWKERLSKQQIKSALEVLKSFGLDKIYSEDIMPDREAALKYLAHANDRSKRSKK